MPAHVATYGAQISFDPVYTFPNFQLTLYDIGHMCNATSVAGTLIVWTSRLSEYVMVDRAVMINNALPQLSKLAVKHFGPITAM